MKRNHAALPVKNPEKDLAPRQDGWAERRRGGGIRTRPRLQPPAKVSDDISRLGIVV